MSKKSSKVTKPATPQVKTVKAVEIPDAVAPSKPVKKTAAPAKKKAVVPKPIVVPSPPVAAATPAPALPDEVVPAPKVVVTAQIDVGFGNALFIRGEGSGLSWDRGVALENVAGDQWSVTLPEFSGATTFKLLINDQVWSLGDNYVAVAGESLTLTPTF